MVLNSNPLLDGDVIIKMCRDQDGSIQTEHIPTNKHYQARDVPPMMTWTEILTMVAESFDKKEIYD